MPLEGIVAFSGCQVTADHGEQSALDDEEPSGAGERAVRTMPGWWAP
jgi:hypothetical protein